MGTHTDAEIWLLTESLIELVAYKVKTHTECPHFGSIQLCVDESDKVNELLGVCLAKLRKQPACRPLDGQALVDVNEGR